MRARWFWGIIILAILALLWALFTAPDRSAAMGDDIRNALRSAGSNAEVDMNGNVATLTGVAKSDDEMARATIIAENAECSACEGKKRWHKVRNDMSLAKAPAKKVVALPIQSPYTFQATKDANGNVVVNGYVRNEAERKRVLAHANALYPGKVTNRTVRLASGAPNADWENVLIGNLDDLKSTHPMPAMRPPQNRKASRPVRSLGTNTISSTCLLYTSPSPRDGLLSRMPSSA